MIVANSRQKVLKNVKLTNKAFAAIYLFTNGLNTNHGNLFPAFVQHKQTNYCGLIVKILLTK